MPLPLLVGLALRYAAVEGAAAVIQEATGANDQVHMTFTDFKRRVRSGERYSLVDAHLDRTEMLSSQELAQLESRYRARGLSFKPRMGSGTWEFSEPIYMTPAEIQQTKNEYAKHGIKWTPKYGRR